MVEISLNDKTTSPAILWDGEVLALLDQRRLPLTVNYIKYSLASELAFAIKDMVVRGAPAIGISAAYAVVLSAKAHQMNVDKIKRDIDILARSRPTAVNLFWALKKMQTELDAGTDLLRLEALARSIHLADIKNNRLMGKLGAALIKKGSSVLTHCNAGALATGGYGTALGVIRQAWQDGKLNRVYADETRPWLQGTRLTAWELQQDGIDCTVVVDGANSWLMQQQQLNWLIVGSDRIAGNGDVANKIGTLAAAVNARHHGLKVMVVAPTSTIDFGIKSGTEIPVETREAWEILQVGKCKIGDNRTRTWNQVFDITPASLVDVLVTEKAVIENPTYEKVQALK